MSYTLIAPHFDGKKSIVNFSYDVGAIRVLQELGEQQKAQEIRDQLLSMVNADPPLTCAAAPWGTIL